MSGFDLSSYGAERTEITDAEGNTAAVIHRPLNIHWRMDWTKLQRRLLSGAPTPPGPVGELAEDADDKARAAFEDALRAMEDYTEAALAYQSRVRREQVDRARTMLGDLVIRFEGITVNDEPAKTSDVLDLMAKAGGEHDKGAMLLDLALAMVAQGNVSTDEEKG